MSRLVEANRPGTYVLMGNGKVVAPDLPMPVEISNLMTSLRAQSMQGRNIGGLLPNIGRCVRPVKTENKTVTILGVQVKDVPVPVQGDTERWIKDIADIVSNSHRRGSCILTGQVSMVDVSTNSMTSGMPFSSTNVLYMALAITWISASFSLFHLRWAEIDDIFSQRVAVNQTFKWGVRVLLVVWHFIIVVLTTLPIMYKDKHIPLNNVLISTVLVVASMAVQIKFFVVEDSKEGSPDDKVMSLFIYLFIYLSLVYLFVKSIHQTTKLIMNIIVLLADFVPSGGPTSQARE